MKKFSRFLIALLIAFATIQVVPIKAQGISDTTYPMLQNEKKFEVALVEPSGNFNLLGAYDSFEEAKSVMKDSGENAVVRAKDANKQTKIIAMNSGVAYSCIWDRVATISLNSISSNATGYMSSYRQINYIETESYSGNGSGKVRANLGGFECTVDLASVELIPYVYVDKQIAVHVADDLYVKPNVASYTVVQNGNYRDLVYTAYSIYAKDGSEAPSVINTAVGPAADWMETGKTYYSVDDVTFYNNRNMTDRAGVYYNYYQFMPLRTKSSIPASVYNGYLQKKGYGSNSVLYNTGEAFIQAQNDYGVNALMVFAQACLESAYGTSNYARTRNNLFGLGAYDSNPDNAYSFSSVYECLKLQMGYYLRNYFYADSSLFFGAHYGNKGSGVSVKYASDPYYGLKISSIAYEMDKYANNYSGNLIEYNSNTIGVINTYEARVLITPGGRCTYTTEYRKGYQLNNTVAIIGEEGDYYKIQSDNYLNTDGTCVNVFENSDVKAYDWNHNTGYILKSEVDIISSNTIIEKPEEELVKIGEVTVNVSKLRVRTAPSTGASFVTYCDEGKTYDVYSITSGDGFTWYQIGRNQYIADNGTWVTYTANGEEKPAEPETPAIPETPVEPETPEESEKPTVEQPVQNDNAHILSFVETVKKENNVLSISGEAFIKGMDVTSVEQTSHWIELIELESGESVSYSAKTEMLSTPEYIGDNHTYQAVLYSADINLADVPAGNYIVKVRVTTDGVTNSKQLYADNEIVNIEEEKDESGYITRVFVNNYLKNRLEISKEKGGIDRKLINKPTIRYSTRGLDHIEFSDNMLTFDGYGYMYQSEMTESVHPSYRIILVDKDGVITSYDLTAKKSLFDYSILYKSDYKLDYADFEGIIDLSNLKAGKYRVYLDMSNDEYRDIDELINFTETKVYSASYGNRSYSLTTSNVHGRFILEVTE